jgi:hypothetical protein
MIKVQLKIKTVKKKKDIESKLVGTVLVFLIENAIVQCKKKLCQLLIKLKMEKTAIRKFKL